jgi:hypothetical protein
LFNVKENVFKSIYANKFLEFTHDDDDDEAEWFRNADTEVDTGANESKR